jgi:hypothetical protein
MTGQEWSACVTGNGMPYEDLEQVVGEVGADKDGQGTANAGDGGVAFILTSAGTIPGGAATVGCPFLAFGTCRGIAAVASELVS